VQVRDDARRLLAAEFAEQHAQIDAARERLASGQLTRLSELGPLDTPAFHLFLSLLGEALTAQSSLDTTVELQSADGLLRIKLTPLAVDSRAFIHTPAGIFAGRDHAITITRIASTA
jgi:uncharacterized protein (TIGR02677 family)